MKTSSFLSHWIRRQAPTDPFNDILPVVLQPLDAVSGQGG